MKTITNLLLGPQCLEFWSSMTPEIHQNDTQISLTCGASKKSQNDEFPTGNRLLWISKCQNFLGARSAPNFRRHRMSAWHRRPNLLSRVTKIRARTIGWFSNLLIPEPEDLQFQLEGPKIRVPMIRILILRIPEFTKTPRLWILVLSAPNCSISRNHKWKMVWWTAGGDFLAPQMRFLEDFYRNSTLKCSKISPGGASDLISQNFPYAARILMKMS